MAPKPENATPLVEGVTPFPDFLRRLEAGELVEDAADALRDLNTKLSEHAAKYGKAKGKLTLTLDLTHEKGLVMVVADVTTKAPRAGREATALWLTPGNNLVGSDPRQLELGKGPRAVAAPSEPPRAVPQAEGAPRAAGGEEAAKK